MDGDILVAENLRLRKGRPFLSNGKICNVFCNEKLIEIGFLSRRCRNDCRGVCIMCDYGAADGTHEIREYLFEMDRILEEADPGLEILLLCTNGSFLDQAQISPELFKAVLTRAAQTPASLVEIETHYRDVTPEKLRQIQELLPGKQIGIEMGLETVNPLLQSHIIMKGICLPDYERTISLIQSYGFMTEVNIMVGLPFLSAKEQIEDAVTTIQWAFQRGCRVVLFPMNIKPYTLLMDMYHSGHYRPISQWMLPLVLDTLSAEAMEQITVAWYGNREERYPNSERAVFPQACPSCTGSIQRFYTQFQKTQGGHERRALLSRLLSQTTCKCLEEARQGAVTNGSGSFASRYADYVSFLKTRSPGRDVM